jgi:hypothetical protein
VVASELIGDREEWDGSRLTLGSPECTNYSVSRGTIGRLYLFFSPNVQALVGLDCIKRAKTSVDILFGGLGRIQRAKRPMLIRCSLFSSLCEQSTTFAVYLLSEGHSH